MGGWKSWGIPQDSRRAFDGRFALHGLDADAEVPAYFLEPGAQARRHGPVLGPVGGGRARHGPARAVRHGRARLVGPDGKPLDRYPAGNLVTMVVTPGPTYGRTSAKDGPLFAEESPLFRLDPANYGNRFRVRRPGAGHVPRLDPGHSYRLVDRTPVMDGGEPAIRKEFIVKPGEALDLGDILIARPTRRN